MSELFDKYASECTKRENFQGSCKPTRKCVMKMKETNKKKPCMCKNVIDGRKNFTGHLRKTGENDWDKLQVNDSGHNEGTICLVNG